MRKTCFVLFLVALITPSITFLIASSAASNKNAASDASPWRSTMIGLPNYDLRHEVSQIQTLSGLNASIESAAMKERTNVIENFRATLPQEMRESLRYEVNEAGVPKAFFNLAGPLSQSSFGTADQIARSFLSERAHVFGLAGSEVRSLKLRNEDKDENITFLHYNQMIDGIGVYQGQVQIAVSALGEVLSVMEGMVIPNGKIDTTPLLSEAEAITEAFKYSGRQASGKLEIAGERSEKGDRVRYKNPLGKNYDDILSELTVMRVGERGVLAWHIYVDAGPSEWYEICVDANTGALLLATTTVVFQRLGAATDVDGVWASTSASLNAFAGQTVTIRIEAADAAGASLVEAGIDDVRITRQ